ncbi:MAG TPA: helix-turn-helix domain-containing protein [Puia sp.]|nr:helix-turn-helix domain-containing protein [Puia sp.]
MKFTQIPAPVQLCDIVRYCWTLESSDRAATEEGPDITADPGTTADPDLPSGAPGAPADPPLTFRTFRTMADGCPGIIFQHPAAGAFHKDDQRLPEIFLYGQSTQHAELSLSGKFNAIGLCLYPNALRSLFGLKAEELTDSCMDLNHMARRQGFRLAEQLADIRASGEKVQLLADYLSVQSGSNSRITDAPMQYALSQILHSKGSHPLKTLQDTLQMTERSFERKFKQWVGISPKLFARICRFQASLTQLRNNDYQKLSDIAFENDYADQSHLIRSFKEFAGLSPNQYQKQCNEVVENLAELIQ